MDLSGAPVEPAILGLRFWIVVWYAILAVGGMGLAGAWMWGRRSGWTNWDEVLRGIGTVAVSLGMLSLLQQYAVSVGHLLLVIAVLSFGMAFRLGRPRQRPALRLIRGGEVAGPRFS
jgi:hypothetical protein